MASSDSANATIGCVAVFVSVGVALVASFLLVPVVRSLLRRTGVLDVPNSRSSHDQPTVRGAGIAPLVASLLAIATFIAVEPGDMRVTYLWLLASIPTCAALLGLIEDTRGIPIAVRAISQLLVGAGGAAAVCFVTGAPWWIVPIFALGIAGYVNVANFMDGINGMSGFHGITVGLAFSLLGMLGNEGWLVPSGLILAAAFMGFLPWNLSRNRVFLGDVGSYFLGACIATLVALAIGAGVPPVAALAPAAIYMFDTGFTLAKRILRGERWFESHRSHVYQLLAIDRHKHLLVSSAVAALTALCAIAGLLALSGTTGTVLACAIIVLAGLIYVGLPTALGASPMETIPELEHHQPEGFEERAPRTWAVIGGSGFVGSAIVDHLRSDGIEVIPVRAPRLSVDHCVSASELIDGLSGYDEEVHSLAAELDGADVVVNAAGLAAPDSVDSNSLFGANALLPLIVMASSAQAGAMRVIHISSASVQGRSPVLNEAARFLPFSVYSRSKALGEKALLGLPVPKEGQRTHLVIVRATSVQGKGRETTRKLQSLAASALSTVCSPGNQPTVVSSITGLAAFVKFVGEHRGSVPTIVLQPWEGFSAEEVLRVASGGRVPRRIPAALGRFAITWGYLLAAVLRPLYGAVRRVELMWFGQRQVKGWAEEVGWKVDPVALTTVLESREGAPRE